MHTTRETFAAGTAAPDARPARDEVPFSFGKNWRYYVENFLTPEREAKAQASIRRFLERDDLRGMSFLDVGCGSGIFSLAAHRLGAARITSFDLDPFSVKCCEAMREKAGNPAEWRIEHGSVLDRDFLSRLEPADLVYAWGSLHHTGSMWEALRNSGALVCPGGLFFLAIYNRVDGRLSSEYWLRLKRFYNRAPAPVKRLLEIRHYVRHGILPQIIRLRNPAAFLREYESRRGMSYWVDIRDWLGGYPYEYASADEVFRFCSRELNMELVNLKTTNGAGTNEFLFRKRA